MKTRPSILFVDDERQFSAMTQEYLESRNLVVTLKHDAKSGLQAYKNGQFDLCIFDVKMPMKDGFTLAREIRELDELIPIIFLTGQTEKSDRIKGLSLGADDYVTKPFSMEELFLRIKNILRRVKLEKAKRLQVEKYKVGIYYFDPASRELSANGAMIKMTAIESKLLQLFSERVNEVVDRELALKRIWGDDDLLRGRSLNVYISKLRRMLKDDPNIEFLNVHGVGYKMVVRDDQ